MDSPLLRSDCGRWFHALRGYSAGMARDLRNWGTDLGSMGRASRWARRRAGRPATGTIGRDPGAEAHHGISRCCTALPDRTHAHGQERCEGRITSGRIVFPAGRGVNSGDGRRGDQGRPAATHWRYSANACSLRRIEVAHHRAGVDLAADPGFHLLLLLAGLCDGVGQVARDHHHAVGIGHHDVPGNDQHATAADRLLHIGRQQRSEARRRGIAAAEHRQGHLLHRLDVAHAAIRHHAGDAARDQASDQDVAECAAGGVAVHVE